MHPCILHVQSITQHRCALHIYSGRKLSCLCYRVKHSWLHAIIAQQHYLVSTCPRGRLLLSGLLPHVLKHALTRKFPSLFY